MIRRDAQAPGETQARWILISQVDHARLAGKLAEQWGASPYAPLEPRGELLWAVYHHDDGWQAWEESPGVDPLRARPRAFTEMEIADSVAIWTQSIELARRAGPLEAYVIAGHFCALGRRASATRGSDPDWPLAQQFLRTFDALMQQWLAAWQQQNPRTNTAAVARLALAQLQFFDALSLWFCCQAADEPATFPTPAGPVVTISPIDAARLQMAPWPLVVGSLNLEIPGRSVPVARYRTAAELAAAPSQPVLLRWQLRPKDAGR